MRFRSWSALTGIFLGASLLMVGDRVGDYSTFPKADQIWITHPHRDHLDPTAIDQIKKEGTLFVADPQSAESLKETRVIVMQNGDEQEIDGIFIEAVPAYNLVRERQPGVKYHPKGLYNGYVATFGDKRVYIAGDTECIPEMASLGPIDVAFIPINLPFTMPPEEAVGCIKVIAPTVAIPYHQGQSDPNVVAELLEGSGIEVRTLPLP
ncbi:MAG: MBL fold metallo-hydrolase [Candidatus Bipolaricaulia bacterium]